MIAPAPPDVVISAPEPLKEWEVRLLRQARLLRAQQKGAKLVVEFEGAAMRLFVAAPAGKVE